MIDSPMALEALGIDPTDVDALFVRVVDEVCAYLNRGELPVLEECWAHLAWLPKTIAKMCGRDSLTPRKLILPLPWENMGYEQFEEYVLRFAGWGEGVVIAQHKGADMGFHRGGQPVITYELRVQFPFRNATFGDFQ